MHEKSLSTMGLIVVSAKISLVASVVLVLLSSVSGAQTDQIFLDNGDRITGKIIDRNEEGIRIGTDSMGVIDIPMERVARIYDSSASTEAENTSEGEGDNGKEIVWKRDFSLGMNAARGNTHTNEVAGDFILNRNHVHENEITLKGNLFYSESDRKMDARKWYTLGRYAFSFTPSRKWYNFYRVETDHNRFSDVYYRVIPATGIGYWIVEREDAKLLLEAAIGWEHTNYISDNESSNEAVFVPRVFFEKDILDTTSISGDVYFYPVIYDLAKYRIRSELAVTNRITEVLSLRFSLINEYDSDPVKSDIKKNDLRVMSSVVLSM